MWAAKNEGAWTIPKGEFNAQEEPIEAARREFHEETGFAISGPLLSLGSVRQKSGKIVTAWAFEGDCSPSELVSNTCQIEWPPRSGRRLTIPEVDRGDWFALTDACRFMRNEQHPFLDSLADHVAAIHARPTVGL